MSSSDPASWVFLVLGMDLLLWVCALFLDVSGEARFRLFAMASLLLTPVVAAFYCWTTAVSLWFAGLWIYAIVRSMSGKSPTVA